MKTKIKNLSLFLLGTFLVCGENYSLALNFVGLLIAFYSLYKMNIVKFDFIKK
jgi:hypothetical protein